MTIEFTRRDIGYTAISRFEESFRAFLAIQLASLTCDFYEGIPSGVVEKARGRSKDAQWEDIEDFLTDIDFPDLKEISCYRGAYQNYFTQENISQKQFDESMDELYLLRCQIAHVKKDFTAIDLDKLMDLSEQIAKQLGERGEEYVNLLNNLRSSPERVTVKIPISFYETVPDHRDIPNNLPVPDYEHDGGFVGRRDDIRKVSNLLKGNRNVITISGAGGVGKTALALRVIHTILNEDNHGFDGVVWLSAKETRLSYLGIQDIEPTLKNYEELLDTIFEVMGFDNPRNSLEKKEADVATVFELYKRVLIVVDNFETITDDRITNFILDIEDNFPDVKILITSRRGLGQVERRHELTQLKTSEAVRLFRSVARDKNLVGLSKIEESILEQYVNKVTCYPLAIKWVIGNVAIGKDINDVISVINETTSDISRFSFEQIYNSLEGPSRKVLCALSILDDSSSAGVLNFVVDMDKEAFEDALQELILVSLVIPESYQNEQDEISTSYTLLSLTRGYVRQQLDDNQALRQTLTSRLTRTQSTIEEAERAQKQIRSGLADLGATTDDEKVAAMIVQNAFHKYQAGRYPEAVEDYQRAIEIAPRFASLYRNWSVMEFQEQHYVEANELMLQASKLNPADAQVWVLWGNIKRKEGKIDDALEKYERAYNLASDDPYILNSYGQAKARSAQFEEADQLFKTALQQSGDRYSKQNEIVNRSSIARNLIRWAEKDSDSRDFRSAQSRLEEALAHCEAVVALDPSDHRSQEVLRKALIKLGFIHKKADSVKAVRYFKRAVVQKPITSMRFKEARDTVEASIQAAKLLYESGDISDAQDVFHRDLRRIKDPLLANQRLRAEFQKLWKKLYESQNRSKRPSHKSTKSGQHKSIKSLGVVKWFSDKRGYGFITPNQGGEIFVHYRDIRGNGYRTLREGQRVEFMIVKEPRGLVAKEVDPTPKSN